MGRRKQSHPHHSVGLTVECNGATEPELDKKKAPNFNSAENEDHAAKDKPYYEEVHKRGQITGVHLDISEVVLTNVNISERFSSCILPDDIYQDPMYSLRFRMCNANQFIDRLKLGHWPVLPSSDITLELVERGMSENVKAEVIWSGGFDGSDEGVSGLVHLVSMEFITLRPVPNVVGMSSLRVRVEILKNAFDACESLLENTRQLWKKSMMNVMAWLRPEVMTSDARYGACKLDETKVELLEEAENETFNLRKCSKFDVAAFYEAIKPSKEEPMLEGNMPDLLPVLRPYQRRAAYWMVQREKGESLKLDDEKRIEFFSPLCIPVGFLDSSSRMFYNPFSGDISLNPEYSSPHVYGGILADDMGLGKTVELLACIFAHRRPAENGVSLSNASSVTTDQKISLRRLKRERVECICGAVSESRKYKGLWVQCDICDAWQHADCVGYSTTGKSKTPGKVSYGQEIQKRRKKETVKVVVREGEYICQMCSELLRATDSPVSTGATLIVCPAPILLQWHSEITRHTHSGSLKTYIYEGVRNASLSDTPMINITELVNADVVLTTYDVLKEDLSHDSDRHDGDRRFLRFQKRYPVIPTLLTRIFWWRICLDEAQMVESNAAAATEMALRLYAKHCWCITGTPIQRKLDDLYGLLRFLKASPFDASRWWVDVIRDPYERRDARAIEFTHKFFKQIMWRSSKAHVADELQLPPQEECVSWLTFSAIEEHFYNRQHETCVSYAREVIESLKHDILKRASPGQGYEDNPLITYAEAAKLLTSLLKLRQACCHPQVGSSGLRSLQQAPMSMDEILMVLVNKTKTEGEEALRALVVALNGLAAIAVIKQEYSQAAELYKEALDLTKEHAEDFRLDPLLKIHILHNLAEMLPMVKNGTKKIPADIQQLSGSPKRKLDLDQNAAKRQRVGENDNSSAVYPENVTINASNDLESGLKEDTECDDESQSLTIACRTLKKKYLSGFTSKLSAAQQEFKKSYIQVCNALSDMEKQHSTWWLDALQLAEQDKDFSRDLIRKIEEAIHGTLNNSNSSRHASRFRTTHGMKLHLQTCMDMMEASRKKLIDRLLEIDQTMEKPKEEDVERISHCKYCNKKDDGPTCFLCELDRLFQDYEARLFRLNKSHKGIMESASAEEAVDLQKKNSALNRFFSTLTSSNKDLTSSAASDEELTKRNANNRVTVSKSPSESEIVLGVIKSYCKAYLDREAKLAATKQLQMLEAMRKEFAHARALAIAQAQFLRAHDEIKMATTRLQLRELEDDISIYTLNLDELDSASVQNTNDKFFAASLLLSIKGKLRYLKGLIKSKQNAESQSYDNSALTQETASLLASMEQKSECLPKGEESCPVCQENLRNQKMVFQCGHVTCCKCLFSMTEPRTVHTIRQKWVMCPICRQHTDVENIAYADDRQDKQCNTSAAEGGEEHEASLTVQGSYGTKIEAVTRRILWIKSTDPEAKVLVFSSWKDVLDVLEHALIANGITFIRMKGGRKSQLAVGKFRGEESPEKEIKKRVQQKEARSIQVLLLLIQHGANGLNLLEAQHVILVEPLLNPAAEAQAVGRVHRIGQEKTTLVHRFIVKGTVEESLYKLNRSRSTNSNSFISGNTKNQDQPFLTLKDIESLFATVSNPAPETEEKPGESLRDLPPSLAAAIAAERRLNENSATSSLT